MKSQWIVVANAAHARLFRRASADEPLVALESMEHPESRLKGSQLGDDRPGHEAVDSSRGGNRFEPRLDPRRKEQLRFARAIADRLDRALAEDGLTSLWLFASDPFLGDLKAELSEAVAHRLSLARSSDWTACTVDELERHLHGLHARA